METKSLHFNETIVNWDEALALGNGDIGCLIWNSADKLRFSLDKNGIWDCSESPEKQENFNYKYLQKLISEKKQDEIVKLFDECYGRVTPTKLPTGKIILDLGVKDNVVSDLDFMTAQAKVKAGNVEVRSFIAADADFGLIEVNKTGIGMKIENPEFGDEKDYDRLKSYEGTVTELKNLHYPKAEFVKTKDGNTEYQYFIQPTHESFYGIISAMRKIEGRTLIAYTVAISDKNDFIETALLKLKTALDYGYNKAFESHKKWWEKYWKQSDINIPDKFLEKQWYLNNYLLASCSRKNHFPMPLQGVWTADNGSLPPWKGDYHHDLNTQMSYTSYLKANHLEQGQCFIDFLLSLTDRAEEFAHSFYDAEGICLPSVMDLKGYALGGWSQYALSPTNQLWLCQIMARYYYFTKDDKYLGKIYDYMKKTGQFLLSMLTEKDGKYKLPLSSSPEIHDNSAEAWLTPNSNYDLALMRCFMIDMKNISRAMGKEDEASEWAHHFDKLEDLAVNEDNVLMLSPDESLKESHRHHAHCMSLYPLKMLEYDTPRHKEIIDATVKNLEELGIEEWVGYSVGWMAEFYIIQGRGDKAAEMLTNFFRYNCTANGFHINGDYLKKTDFRLKYRLFTLEANFLACDAIQDMLLYTEKGKIKLFPAIPTDWKNVSFETFRGYGAVLVSASMVDGKIAHVEIEALADARIEIMNDLDGLNCNKKAEQGIYILNKGEKLIFV